MLISSINLALEFLDGAGESCLLVEKFSGFKEEQLLRINKNAIAGKICLTITSFFLG
jgi:hypothetical protein